MRTHTSTQERKCPTLKQATLLVQIYKNGTPQGFRKVKTNKEQLFTICSDLRANLEPTLVVEVLSVKKIDRVKGISKKVSCSGTSRIKKSEIVVQCSL